MKTLLLILTVAAILQMKSLVWARQPSRPVYADEYDAAEKRLQQNGQLHDPDRQLLERLVRERPVTIHKLDRFRLDDLLRKEERR